MCESPTIAFYSVTVFVVGRYKEIYTILRFTLLGQFVCFITTFSRNNSIYRNILLKKAILVAKEQNIFNSNLKSDEFEY